MKKAMSNPNPLTNSGMALDDMIMTDLRWPAKEGWVKVSRSVTNVNLRKDNVEIHCVWNKFLNMFDDFKFKDKKAII